MINDWNLPVTGQSLFSLVGFIIFYHQLALYLKFKLKPFRRLSRTYNRQPIPMMAWTTDLIALFHELRVSITFSPFLSCFDSEKPIVLKTYWSAEGTGWIMIQPADDEESQTATAHLKKNGYCLFYLCKNGARLKPVALGYCSCNDMEIKYRSFN